jgi:hypothetical protein
VMNYCFPFSNLICLEGRDVVHGVQG